MEQNDIRLTRLLTAGPDRYRGELEYLVEQIIRPTALAVLKRKYGDVLGGKVTSGEEEAFWDVLGLALQGVLQRIEKIRQDPTCGTIASVEAYSVVSAHRAFGRYLSAKYPERAKHCDAVREAIDDHPRLDRWRVAREEASGKAEWKPSASVTNSNSALMVAQPKDAASQCFRGSDPKAMMLPHLLLETYAWVGGPARTDSVVGFTSKVLGIQDRQKVEPKGDEEEPGELETPSGAPGTDDRAHSSIFANAILETVRTCARKDQAGVTLLFDPPGNEQESLAELLVQAEIITEDELAELVGLPLIQVQALRGCERITFEMLAQVYNLGSAAKADGIRKGTMERLRRTLIREEVA